MVRELDEHDEERIRSEVLRQLDVLRSGDGMRGLLSLDELADLAVAEATASDANGNGADPST
ncbi:MAG: hypothetical protein AAGD35_23215 [Actinomycetota bacterium]